MIKFLRRRLNCWSVCDDYDHLSGEVKILEFENKDQLFKWIYKTLPFTFEDKKYPLRIKDKTVIQWSVLGWID